MGAVLDVLESFIEEETGPAKKSKLRADDAEDGFADRDYAEEEGGKPVSFRFHNFGFEKLHQTKCFKFPQFIVGDVVCHKGGGQRH